MRALLASVCVLITLFLCGHLVPARAEPEFQALALLPTAGPVRLSCDSEICRAEIASMCLEPDRLAPSPGRIYVAAARQGVRIHGVDRHGRQIELPLPATARFIARRTHVAVSVQLQRRALPGRLATVTGIAVDDLTPVRPLTRTEAGATAAARLALAHQVLAQRRERMAANGLTNRLVNRLLAEPAGSVADPAALWRTELNAAPRQRMTPPVVAQARFDFELCRFLAEQRDSERLLGCLQARQDGAVEDAYQDYVAAMNAGA